MLVVPDLLIEQEVLDLEEVHPCRSYLIGRLKWVLKSLVLTHKCFLAPFV